MRTGQPVPDGARFLLVIFNHGNGNNMKNTKTIKTILFAGLIMTIVIPISGINMAHGSTDYFKQAIIVFDDIQRLDAEIIQEKNQLSQVSDNKAIDLERKISDKQTKLDELWKEMDRLEKLNNERFTVAPEIYEKLENIHEVLKNKYVSSKSTTYVGDNPVERIGVNWLTQSIIVLLNPDKLTDEVTSYSMKELVSDDIHDIVGENIPIEIQIGKMTPLSCTAKDAVCRPIIGGITVARDTDTSLNTIGYKATKTSYGTGFVVAAHTVLSVNEVVHQPHDETSETVGTVKAYCWISTDKECDFAYVQSTETVNNEIFKSNNNVYTITGKTVDSSQDLGDWVYKVGARTGISLGQVSENSGTEYYNKVEIYHGAGDSGAPIFALSGDNANLYGILFSSDLPNPDNPGLDDAYYYAYDYVQSKIGAVPP